MALFPLPSFLSSFPARPKGGCYCWQGGLGGAQTFAASEKLVELLKKQRESNKPYGAICASPALVLEPHGLLKVKAQPFVYFKRACEPGTTYCIPG